MNTMNNESTYRMLGAIADKLKALNDGLARLGVSEEMVVIVSLPTTVTADDGTSAVVDVRLQVTQNGVHLAESKDEIVWRMVTKLREARVQQ